MCKSRITKKKKKNHSNFTFNLPTISQHESIIIIIIKGQNFMGLVVGW